MKEFKGVGDLNNFNRDGVVSRDAWILTFHKTPTDNHFVINEKLDIYLSKNVPCGYYQLPPGQNYHLKNKYGWPLYFKPFDNKDYEKLVNASWFVKTLQFLHQEFGIEYIELADRILYRDESPGPKLEMDLKKRSTPEIISFNKLIYIIVNNTIEYGQFYRVEDIDDHCPKTQFFVETPLELYKY